MVRSVTVRVRVLVIDREDPPPPPRPRLPHPPLFRYRNSNKYNNPVVLVAMILAGVVVVV